MRLPRYSTLFAGITLLWSFAACSPVAAPQASAPISVCDVILSPHRYDGKVVTVRGRVDLTTQMAALFDSRCGPQGIVGVVEGKTFHCGDRSDEARAWCGIHESADVTGKVTVFPDRGVGMVVESVIDVRAPISTDSHGT